MCKAVVCLPAAAFPSVLPTSRYHTSGKPYFCPAHCKHMKLGAGVPLRYDGAKKPSAGETLAKGMYKYILSIRRKQWRNAYASPAPSRSLREQIPLSSDSTQQYTLFFFTPRHNYFYWRPLVPKLVAKRHFSNLRTPRTICVPFLLESGNTTEGSEKGLRCCVL
jgi:hypothetical protein